MGRTERWGLGVGRKHSELSTYPTGQQQSVGDHGPREAWLQVQVGSWRKAGTLVPAQIGEGPMSPWEVRAAGWEPLIPAPTV
jgi:hypothetical protein